MQLLEPTTPLSIAQKNDPKLDEAIKALNFTSEQHKKGANGPLDLTKATIGCLVDYIKTDVPERGYLYSFGHLCSIREVLAPSGISIA